MQNIWNKQTVMKFKLQIIYLGSFYKHGMLHITVSWEQGKQYKQYNYDKSLIKLHINNFIRMINNIFVLK